MSMMTLFVLYMYELIMKLKLMNVWFVWVDDDDELNVYEYDNVWITYLSKVKLMILIELYGFYVLDDALSWLKWLWKM